MIYLERKSLCKGREPSLGSLVIKSYERFICTKIIGEDVLLYPIQNVTTSCNKNSTFHVLVHTISYSIELKINAYSGRNAQSFKKIQNVPNI